MAQGLQQIQLTNTGIAGTFDEAALAREFQSQHFLCLPQFLAPNLLTHIQRQMDSGPWTDRSHGKLGHELTLANPLALHLLRMLMNRPDFLTLFQRISGKGPFQCFEGRVYRMQPIAEHFDAWHNDIVPEKERMVGLSINLGREPYEGGVFLMRDRHSKKLLAELPNLIPGDARLFNIDRNLEHTVTSVTGTFPKTAYAGWFQGNGLSLVDHLRAGGSH